LNKIKKIIKKTLFIITGNKPFKNKLPKLDSIKKILVISLYFKGDFLFHSAFLQALKEYAPDSKIDLWLKSRLLDLAENDPRFNSILIFDYIKTANYRENSKLRLKEKFNFLKRIRQNNYDLIFDLTGKYSTALFTLLSSARFTVGINYNYFGFCYDKFVYLNTSTDKGHLIDKYLSVLPKGLNIDINNWELIRRKIGTKPIIYIDKMTRELIDRKLNELNIINERPFITLHVTSGWKAKELDSIVFADLIKYLISKDYNFLFVGDQADLVKLKEINTYLIDLELDIEKYLLRLSFIQSAELIKRSDLFIGSDSAPLHVAGAVGTPSIGLFGPTNPEFSRPHGEIHRIIYHKLWCSSSEERQYCTRNGGMTCPTIDCMKLMTSKEIIDSIEELLIKYPKK
jgi:ADP-heptose:LPS heptosyltransferase